MTISWKRPNSCPRSSARERKKTRLPRKMKIIAEIAVLRAAG